MDKKLEIFKHEVFGDLEIFIKEDDYWFKGNDIASILGYSNISRDIQRHVDEEDKWLISNKSTEMVPFEIPTRGTILINESGLYSLIIKSKLPQAKIFKRWITSEVLPSIRKHGGYFSGQEDMSPEELMAKAVIVAQSQIELLQNKVKEKEHLISDKNYPISLTKMLSGNNKLAQAANIWMEDKGWIKKLFSKGVRKGWELTEEGEKLGYGSNVQQGQVFWVPSILEELPSEKELLLFAKEMDLINHKKS